MRPNAEDALCLLLCDISKIFRVPNEMKNNLQYQFFEASINAANSKSIINDTANPILQIDNF